MQQHYPILLACVLGALCGGCIDSAYDLDKIDKENHAGTERHRPPAGRNGRRRRSARFSTRSIPGAGNRRGGLPRLRACRPHRQRPSTPSSSTRSRTWCRISRPETIEMTDATLPETLFVEGSTHRTRIDLPALAFAEYDAGVIEHDERLAVDFAGGTFPANTPRPPSRPRAASSSHSACGASPTRWRRSNAFFSTPATPSWS